jgi:signal transduction histidine kinase
MSDFSGFDHIFDAVLIINLKREIIYFNHQANIFFKLPPRIIKQKNFVTQICDSNDLDIEEWLSKALLSFDVLISPEIKLSIPHEADLDYFVVLKLIPIQTEKGANFALVFHDLTVEKTLHIKYRDQMEELKKTHGQILQADKLTTLGELTANISHEINNPLTIAAGHSEIIKDMLARPNIESKLPKIQSANNAVIESIERVNQIIKNMQDFLHQSEDQKEYCDLESLVDAAIEWVQPAAKKANVQIRKQIKIKSVALANRIKLEQVIINLIKNSIDALVDSGKTEGAQILIGLTKSDIDHQTFIDVLDNGPGLSADMKKNLFKPFHSTKDAGRGTGLGLSICQKIIESHTGRLEHLESKIGCHFRIRLPLIEVYSYTRNDKSLSGSKSQKKILVLDNEVQILNVLNSFVNDEGLVFVGSSDPIDSLSFLAKANVDLILTDYSMPEMNGSEFSKRAREQGYSGPILYMTGSKHVEQYNNDKTALNVSGLIIKPFNRDDVMKTIRLALKAGGSV